MPTPVFIFECSTATYFDCVQKGLFGSNVPWPLQIKTGDYCCLYHYEVGTLFALWRATTDGARNLVPRAWGRRFPFQARVALITRDIIEIPKTSLGQDFFNPETGKFDNVLRSDRAKRLVQAVQNDHPE